MFIGLPLHSTPLHSNPPHSISMCVRAQLIDNANGYMPSMPRQEKYIHDKINRNLLTSAHKSSVKGCGLKVCTLYLCYKHIGVLEEILKMNFYSVFCLFIYFILGYFRNSLQKIKTLS